MSSKAVSVRQVPVVIPPCFPDEIKEFKFLRRSRGESQSDFLKRKVLKLKKAKDCMFATAHQTEYDGLLTNFKTSNPSFVQTVYFKKLDL